MIKTLIQVAKSDPETQDTFPRWMLSFWLSKQMWGAFVLLFAPLVIAAYAWGHSESLGVLVAWATSIWAGQLLERHDL